MLVVPCGLDRVPADAPEGVAQGYYGSLLPAVWSFMLAARSRGLGTAWTTLHLGYVDEAGRAPRHPVDRHPVGPRPGGLLHRRRLQARPAARRGRGHLLEPVAPARRVTSGRGRRTGCTSTPTSPATPTTPARSPTCLPAAMSRSSGSPPTSTATGAAPRWSSGSSTWPVHRPSPWWPARSARRPTVRPTTARGTTSATGRTGAQPRRTTSPRSTTSSRRASPAGRPIVAIGALTNLAALERPRPGALAAADIVAMAGWMAPPRSGLPAVGPEMDFNVQCDIVAAQLVAQRAGG